MQPELTGRIVAPGDAKYDAAREEFNTFFNRYPLLLVFARETQDVANAVRWARWRGVPIRVRSGRHSYEGFSTANGAVIIDVSEMNRVEVDGRAGTATVQTGALLIPFYAALAREGWVVPAGTCPNVGIAGLTLGGGIGMLSRKWGLTCDHLLALEMVDANGDLLHADDHRHADLLWASRGGGGGNFGICTSFRFRTHRLETVGYSDIIWDGDDLAPVLRAWQDFAPAADRRLTLTLSGTAQRQGSLRSLGVFVGPAAELHRLLQPLLSAGAPLQVTVEEVPWLEAVRRVAATDQARPYPFKITGSFLYEPLADAGVATVCHFLETSPGPQNGFWTQSLGGAVAKVPPHATAFYHRRACSALEYTATWSTLAEAEQSVRWVEHFRRAMRPYTRGDYVNWPDVAISDWPQAYYGSNLAELTRVKARYDPEDVFHGPQSIPPARRKPHPEHCVTRKVDRIISPEAGGCACDGEPG